jgi:hypothetical protein
MESRQPHTYEAFLVPAMMLWAKSVATAAETCDTVQWKEAIANLIFLHRVFVAWPAKPCEQRHQHAMLILIEDTALWAEARRDGCTAHAAKRDLREAYQIVCYEAQRLFGSNPEAPGYDLSLLT